MTITVSLAVSNTNPHDTLVVAAQQHYLRSHTLGLKQPTIDACVVRKCLFHGLISLYMLLGALNLK